MAKLPTNNKFQLRDSFYKSLEAPLSKVNSQTLVGQEAGISADLGKLIFSLGLLHDVNRQESYGQLQIIRGNVISARLEKLAKDDLMRTKGAAVSERTGRRAAPVVSTTHSEQECLVKGIRELYKQDNAATLGKRIRQLLVDFGADPSRIGHAIPSC
jgi:hypothetical protein